MNIDCVRAFVGHRIVEMRRVVVRTADREFELPDTAVFLVDGSVLIQVMSDVDEKRVRVMSSAEDVEITGEYDDRVGVDLRLADSPMLPADVRGAYVAYEAATDSGETYLIGALLYDGNRRPIAALRVHIDELAFESPDSFWNYIGLVLPQTREIVFERV